MKNKAPKKLHPVIYSRADLAAIGGIVVKKPSLIQDLPSEVVNIDPWTIILCTNPERFTKPGSRYARS